MPGPPLRQDVACDVAVIGAGYTGLWTAHFLKQADPGLSVHLLEMDYAGAGASGHNDGFVTPTIGHSLHGVVRRWGPERAAEAYAAVGRSIMEIGRFCDKNAVDAELERTGFHMVATSPWQVRRLEHDRALAALVGTRSLPEIARGADARDVIGSPAILAAMPSGGALINPHRLARGLARVVTEQGAVIHERTRAHQIYQDGGRYRIRTDHATVSADKVLVATDAYQHTFPMFRRASLPIWSYALVTEPLTDAQLARVHWPRREGFVESRNFIVFGRLTADNRILFGGGPAPYRPGRDMDESRWIHDRDVERFLLDAFHRYFPVWTDVRVSHSYGGCIGVTRDLVPHVGRHRTGLYYAHGYCGNGIATTHTASKALRDLILDRDTPYARLPFVASGPHREAAFPVEPVTRVGAKALSAVLALQDRRPDLLRRTIV